MLGRVLGAQIVSNCSSHYFAFETRLRLTRCKERARRREGKTALEAAAAAFAASEQAARTARQEADEKALLENRAIGEYNAAVARTRAPVLGRPRASLWPDSEVG